MKRNMLFGGSVKNQTIRILLVFIILIAFNLSFGVVTASTQNITMTVDNFTLSGEFVSDVPVSSDFGIKEVW